MSALLLGPLVRAGRAPIANPVVWTHPEHRDDLVPPSHWTQVAAFIYAMPALPPEDPAEDQEPIV